MPGWCRCFSLIAHISLVRYTEALFDFAQDRDTPKGFRNANAEELEVADKKVRPIRSPCPALLICADQAMAEALSLWKKGTCDLNAALIAVSKPGGLLHGLVRPVPVTEKKLESQSDSLNYLLLRNVFAVVLCGMFAQSSLSGLFNCFLTPPVRSRQEHQRPDHQGETVLELEAQREPEKQRRLEGQRQRLEEQQQRLEEQQ